MARKISDEQIAEALNPALSDTVAVLCGQEITIKTMPLSVEQVFLRGLRSIVPQKVDGAEIVQALVDVDPVRLCGLAAAIAANSGLQVTADEIAQKTRLVDIVEAIEMQVEKQGYLDFLLRMAAMLPATLTAKP